MEVMSGLIYQDNEIRDGLMTFPGNIYDLFKITGVLFLATLMLFHLLKIYYVLMFNI